LFRSIEGLWRESEAFLCPPDEWPRREGLYGQTAPVFENSTACVCDEKRSRPLLSGLPARVVDIVYPVNLELTTSGGTEV
jgi:hypothetical protein